MPYMIWEENIMYILTKCTCARERVNNNNKLHSQRKSCDERTKKKSFVRSGALGRLA